MKRRIATLVLFIGAIMSRTACGDNWVPGKPIEPDPWFLGITSYFSDLWTYLMY